MKPEGTAKTICLGELFSLNPMLMIFGAALLTAVGLLVFLRAGGLRHLDVSGSETG